MAGRTDEIVGIVPDVVTDVRRTSPLLVYQPIAQQPHNPYRTFLIRARNPALAARDASAILHAFDAEMMATPVETIDDGMLAQLAPQRFGLSILGVLGAIAVLLTLLGAYVLAESMVAVRRREMGIRSALGGSVFRLASGMMGETAILAGAGVIVGLGLAWLAAGTIRALLFQTAPLDPATLAAVALTILVLTFAVSLRPALRAARVDLASVLREN